MWEDKIEKLQEAVADFRVCIKMFDFWVSGKVRLRDVMVLQEAVKHIPPGGNIIFVSSLAAFNPSAPLAFYGVSKTALLGVTRVSHQLD